MFTNLIKKEKVPTNKQKKDAATLWTRRLFQYLRDLI